MEGLVNGADGDGGGLAPLAAAIEEAAANGGIEGASLIGAGFEGEAVAREGDDVREVPRFG